MRLTKSPNIVFLIPVIVLVVGLLATAKDVRRSETQRGELLKERFESDAAVRLLFRDTLAQRLRMHLRDFLQDIVTTNIGELEQAIDHAANILAHNYASDPASEIVHFFVATVDPEQRVSVAYAYPRPELVGQRISGHPMELTLIFRAQRGGWIKSVYGFSRE